MASVAVGAEARLQFDLFDAKRTVTYEDERIVWSDHDIEVLRDGMLLRLSWLDEDRPSAEEKREWLKWLKAPFHPLDEPAVTRDLRTPFSFQVCCLAAGVDPEEMRDRILKWLGPKSIEPESECDTGQLSWFTEKEKDT
jgi:hypothetical protein